MSSKRSERDFHIGGYAPRKQRDDGSAGDTGIQLAKSTSSKDQVFTNCGKADDQETAETGIAQAADRRRAAACVGPLGHRLALDVWTQLLTLTNRSSSCGWKSAVLSRRPRSSYRGPASPALKNYRTIPLWAAVCRQSYP